MKQGWVKYNDGPHYHYVDGNFHNDDGPAIIHYNGAVSWWYKGEWIGDSWTGYTQEKFEVWKRFKAFI